ncbi:MAG: guanylate kinase [Helicobacter sp.]|nr:guanylate kinase [Helicobacter sp.]
MNNGCILIISGPSGSGKSTLLKILHEKIPNFYFSVSATTRAPREFERHGREYFFEPKEMFLNQIENDEFLEWEKVHDNYYGTLKAPIDQALSEGKMVVFDVDVKGHRNIKRHYASLSRSVFITTPSDLVLKQRLMERLTENKEDILKRLKNAYDEINCVGEFDFLIINDDITKAQNEILNIAKILPNAIFNAQDLTKIWRNQIS